MLKYLWFIRDHILQSVLKRRIRPRVLQMPITGRCNSRCVTCGIWRAGASAADLDPEALRRVLADPFFSRVRVVGLNGGEPSLYKDFDALLDALFQLKRLRRIHVITNALNGNAVKRMMRTIKEKCGNRGIKVYLTISIDGIGEIHDRIRGIPDAFGKTLAVLEELRAEPERYCDELDVGCTVSQQNVAGLPALEGLLDDLGVAAYYHPAVPNKRLHNFGENDFSLLRDRRSLLLATEYFYGKFKYGGAFRTRLRAFLIYYYLRNNGTVRPAGCHYLRSDVTITETLDLHLCAAASDRVGNLLEHSASELLATGALKKEEQKVCRHCSGCVHYATFPSFRGMYWFAKELLKPSVWIRYKIFAGKPCSK